MLGHRFGRYFLAPPSHKRDDWLFGFGFGAIWLAFTVVRGFALPDVLLTLMLILRGAAEILPRTWLVPAAFMRSFSLIAGISVLIWLGLRWLGWLTQ